MKQKIVDLAIFLIFLGSIIYIYGTAGASDCNLITFKECTFRVVIGLIVLGCDAVLFLCFAGRRKRIDRQDT